MELKVYNSMTGKKEKFIPIHKGKVEIYVCGVTVYDECHLGHGRAYVAFDVIRRYLEYSGYEVNYVQNFTDVDDKLIARAREMKSEGQAGSLKELIRKVADKYTKSYFESMDRLNIKRAGSYPRATEHIEDMLKLIGKLMDKGYAYQVDGNVFFEVGKFKGYGCLSGRNLDDLQAGARVEVDQRKRSPMDFALWKTAKEDEPAWDSPWGKGRPGWHIECSVMSMKYLGETFDIHGGGQDLVFPHHENEIAQSRACTDKRLANYWLHNGFVTINREKMSKSLGNFFTLSQIFTKFAPPVVRLFLLSTHYRKPVDFSDDKLEAAAKGLERLRNCYREAKRVVETASLPASGVVTEGNKEITVYKERFRAAMNDDFNTPEALGAIFELVNQLNSWVSKEQNVSLVRESLSLLEELGAVLGLEWEDKENRELEEELMSLIKKREEARRAKDWKQADILRKELENKGIVLEDRPGGTTWRWE